MYEYACHEGNKSAMTSVLNGARAANAAAAKKWGDR